MECRADIFVKCDADKLIACLAPEDTKFDRSSFTVHKLKDGVEFDINAKDAVALRATLSTISQLITVFEGGAKRKT